MIVGSLDVKFEPYDFAIGVWASTPAGRDGVDQLQAPARRAPTDVGTDDWSDERTVEHLDTDECPLHDDFEMDARPAVNHRVRHKFGDEEASVHSELGGSPWSDEFERVRARQART